MSKAIPTLDDVVCPGCAQKMKRSRNWAVCANCKYEMPERSLVKTARQIIEDTKPQNFGDVDLGAWSRWLVAAHGVDEKENNRG